MAPSRVLSPQSVWDLPAVLAAFRERGIKERHVYKIWSMLLKNPDVAWSDIPDLPKAAAALLEQQFSRCTSTVLRCQQSTGGDTTKLLIQLQDGMQVEAVVMHYDTSDRYTGREEAAGWGNKRSTLCVSSQVGCQMGCTFCATGTMGLKGNLCCGEIVEQLVHATRVTPIRNIVFMGMGEPLSNYEAVKAAVGMMGEPRLFGIGCRHITVSTVGVIPRIKQMAADLPGVSLALSLHAPTQELRRTIVPSARAYPLAKLMDAVAEYQAASQQRVFVEYVVLAGVNDGPEQAHELGQLLQGRDMVINLIPWNPVYQPDGPFFAAPAEGSVEGFQRILRSSYGLHCTIRQEKGQDISGACGQLVIQHAQQAGGCSSEAAGSSSSTGGLKDIEELVAAAPAAAR
uniref:Radical SAM core domain-containing protein n=1 Tax=Tetradesmus obliquus TaxID=3088 RepID=A0A383VBW3_TETOB|eukprot:jgi/Sobl393_1/5613/SZX63067.1